MNKKIDVMIVGAQKAGTTSLLRYLGEHPNCISHPQKEFAYFTDDKEFKEGLDVAFKKYYSFKESSKKNKVIAKNAGLYAREYALKRLQENNPDCEIIYLLRNPTERTYSSYLMEKNAGSAQFEFNDLPKLMSNHKDGDELWGYNFFINYSIYVEHLKLIYNYFPKDKVTIILYEDLKADALAICQRFFEKAGVDKNFKPNVNIKHNITLKTHSFTYARVIRRLLNNENPLKKAIKRIVPGHKVWKYGELLRETNKTSKKHDLMDSSVKNYLIEFYKPYNEELAQLIKRDLSDWNK